MGGVLSVMSDIMHSQEIHIHHRNVGERFRKNSYWNRWMARVVLQEINIPGISHLWIVISRGKGFCSESRFNFLMISRVWYGIAKNKPNTLYFKSKMQKKVRSRVAYCNHTNFLMITIRHGIAREKNQIFVKSSLVKGCTLQIGSISWSTMIANSIIICFLHHWCRGET